MKKPKAIPTEYQGHTMRSRFEANVAMALDGLGLPWQYEPKSFLLDNGKHYMPDFYIPTQKTWVEARGYGDLMDWNIVYFASERLSMEWIERFIIVPSSHIEGGGQIMAYDERWHARKQDHCFWTATLAWCSKCNTPFFYDWSDATCLTCHYNDGIANMHFMADMLIDGIEVSFSEYGDWGTVLDAAEIMKLAKASYKKL